MSIQKIAKYSVFLTFFPFIFTFLFPGKIAVVTILCSYPVIITLIYYKFKQPKESLYQDSNDNEASTLQLIDVVILVLLLFITKKYIYS